MRSVPIDTYLTFGNGKQRPADEGIGNFKIFGSNGVIGYCDEFNNPAGTVIIGRVGSYCGSVHYSANKCWVTDNAMKGNAKSNADPRYCYYLLLTTDLHALRGGSGQPLINQTSVKSLEVPERDLVDQKAIAYILGTLDDKIELNQKMNQTLEEIAKAIFKSWFVDFDPVRAKAEDRPTGLPPEISDLFPDEFMDSEIGEIPRGWEVNKLSKYVDVLNGFAFKSTDYEAQGIRVLRTKNFNHGIVEKLADDVFLPEIFMNSHSKHVCEPYDYHMVMVGASIGARGMLFPHQIPALRNQNMWCFRSKNKKQFSQLLIKLYLDGFISSKMGIASGSAREFFRKGDFQSHQLCFATDLLRDYFSKNYSSILEKIQNNLAQNETLTELRDTLLPKLISGELRIPDAEKFLEEAGI